MSGISREFLAERDLRIFKMRQQGISVNEIARRFGISVSACNTAIQRQLQKMNKEALMAYPEVLRMELERLDALQQSIWPMTQNRKITLDDGTEAVAEPDLKAIQQVLAIMDRRSKLLGMEQTNIALTVDTSEPVARAALAGADAPASVNAFSAEEEARKLLSIMGMAGVLPEDTVQDILGAEAPQALEAPKPREEHT